MVMRSLIGTTFERGSGWAGLDQIRRVVVVIGVSFPVGALVPFWIRKLKVRLSDEPPGRQVAKEIFSRLRRDRWKALGLRRSSATTSRRAVRAMRLAKGRAPTRIWPNGERKQFEFCVVGAGVF